MNAQQLRNSILQQAIEGRLVPQDPNDEPASVLLERIREEKRRLVKEGKLKKKDLEEVPISEDEKTFEIPESWEWVRFFSVFQLVTNLVSPKMYLDYPHIAPDIIEKGTGRLLDYRTVKDNKVISNNHLFYKGQIVYSKIRPLLRKAVIAPFDGLCSADMYPLSTHLSIDYALYYLFSDTFNRQVSDICSSRIKMPKINQNELSSVIVPLPPLAEQHRIVAKIEELMPKVEEYGKAQDALDKLNEELPEKLKKSILQEAIEGRLVPQDPNDEPASVLLDKIRKEKAQLVKEGKLKKKDLEETPISEDEIPFEIPESWEWCRLGFMVSNQTGLSYNKDNLQKKVENPIRVLRGGNIQNGDWSAKADDIMIAPEFVKKQNLFLQRNTFITPAVTSLEHLGKTALIKEDHEDIVAGGFILYLLPYYRDNMIVRYLSYFFQSAFYNSYCKSIANKSGQAFWNLSRNKLMSLAVPLPPLAEQHRIVAKIEELFSGIDKLKCE